MKLNIQAEVYNTPEPETIHKKNNA